MPAVGQQYLKEAETEMTDRKLTVHKWGMNQSLICQSEFRQKTKVLEMVVGFETVDVGKNWLVVLATYQPSVTTKKVLYTANQ